MKKMKSKITFNTSGTGSISGRVTIPKPFLEIWGASKENNEIDITMENGCIVLTRKFFKHGEKAAYQHLNQCLDDSINFAETILAKIPFKMKKYLVCSELEKQGIELFKDYIRAIEEDDLIEALLEAYKHWRGEKTEERFSKACSLDWDELLSESDWDRLRKLSNEMVIDFLR